MRRGSLAISIALVLVALPARALAACQLERYAELPVTMAGTEPLIVGSINGVNAAFIADSGSFFSALSEESAKRFKLHLNSMPGGMEVRGLGGAADARSAVARDFTLAGWSSGTLHNVEFVVVGNSFAAVAAGLIGQNVLGQADTEYDLANGVIRLFHTKGCRDRSLAYWQQSGAVAVVELANTSALSLAPNDAASTCAWPRPTPTRQADRPGSLDSHSSSRPTAHQGTDRSCLTK